MLKNIIILILVSVLTGTIVYVGMNEKDETDVKTEITQESLEEEKVTSTELKEIEEIVQSNVENIAFTEIAVDNEELELSEEQKEIISYFDNNYFRVEVSEYDNLQRYPNIYSDTQVVIAGRVDKLLLSTEEEYEALVSISVDINYNDEFEETEKKFVIKGKQNDVRLVEGDFIDIYGRYVDVTSYDIDGISYVLPEINVLHIVHAGEERFDLEKITNVAKIIFGSDIKMKKPVSGIDYEYNTLYFDSYLVTLDNQINNNFDSFVFSTEMGYLIDLRLVTENIGKEIQVSPDLQHYIIKSYDKNIGRLYLEYYDRELNKIWSREFDGIENISSADYTTEKICIALDNELFIIDTENGEDIIEPVYVGKQSTVYLVGDKVLLIGKDKEDMIKMVNSEGKVEWKVTTKYSENISYNGFSKMQMVDENYVINWSYVDKSVLSCYIVIDEEGNVIYETK